MGLTVFATIGRALAELVAAVVLLIVGMARAYRRRLLERLVR